MGTSIYILLSAGFLKKKGFDHFMSLTLLHLWSSEWLHANSDGARH